MIRHPSYYLLKKSRVILCFDATTECLWAAMVDKGGQVKIFKTKNITSGLDRSRHMIRLIAKLCKHVKPVAIATVVGPAKPGGVRLGVVIANALAFAWGMPVRSCIRINNRLVKFKSELKSGYLRPQYIHPPHITK